MHISVIIIVRSNQVATSLTMRKKSNSSKEQFHIGICIIHRANKRVTAVSTMENEWPPRNGCGCRPRLLVISCCINLFNLASISASLIYNAFISAILRKSHNYETYWGTFVKVIAILNLELNFNIESASAIIL